MGPYGPDYTPGYSLIKQLAYGVRSKDNSQHNWRKLKSKVRPSVAHCSWSARRSYLRSRCPRHTQTPSAHIARCHTSTDSPPHNHPSPPSGGTPPPRSHPPPAGSRCSRCRPGSGGRRGRGPRVPQTGRETCRPHTTDDSLQAHSTSIHYRVPESAGVPDDVLRCQTRPLV